MAVITAKLYDGKTPFNNVPVEKINKAWGNVEHVLIYKDGEFAGIAEEKGLKSVEQWQEFYQNFYDEQDRAEEAAKIKEAEEAAKLTEQQEQLNRIEQGTNQLLSDIRTEAVDEYTLELVESGVL